MKNNSMKKTNLFKEYRKAEDAVTKGLAKFLDEHEHFNEKFFERIETEVPIEPKVILQSTEDGSRPDIKILSKNMVVYAESKLKTRLRQNQCKAQLNDLKKEKPENRIFLLISLWKKEYSFLDTYERENPEIDFCYLDWRDIYRIADDLSDEHENTLDSSAADYLLNEYKEKLLKEGVEAFTGLTSEEITHLEDDFDKLENDPSLEGVSIKIYDKERVLDAEIDANLGSGFYLRLTGENYEDLTNTKLIISINNRYMPNIVFTLFPSLEPIHEDESKLEDDEEVIDYQEMLKKFKEDRENSKGWLKAQFLKLGEDETIISTLNSLGDWYIFSGADFVKCKNLDSLNRLFKMIDNLKQYDYPDEDIFCLVKFYTFSDFKTGAIVNRIINDFNKINFLR